MLSLRRPVVSALLGCIAALTIAACGSQTTVDERQLPHDEAARSAIAAIARAQREAGDVPFIEDRKPLPTPAAGAAATGMDAVLNRHQLVVAMLGVDNPPFFWHRPDGKLTGFDVLLAQDIALNLGVSLRINTAAKSFDEVVDEVRTGRASLGISKLSRTMGRAREIAFTEPYVDLHRAFLANRLALARYAADRALIPAIQRFRGRLGVIERSSYEAYARSNFPQAELVRFPTWQAEVDAVRAGTIVAGFRDELEVSRVLDLDPTASLKLRSIVFTDSSDSIAIAVAGEQSQLRLFVDVFLDGHELERLPAEAILYAYPQNGPA